MMCDLFSSLDGMYSYISWGVTFIFIMMSMFNSTFNSKLNIVIMFNLVTLWGKKLYPMKSLFLVYLMFLLMMNNLVGLTPYTFGVTSSLILNSAIASITWFFLLLSGFTFSFMMSFAHLAPAGAPAILLPFLIIIETISILIRPLTLTVRLVANISAGHIVLGLIANLLSSSISTFTLLSIYFLMVGYYLFELFVCFIQAYIFTLLISLYASEHPYLMKLLKHLIVN